MIRVLVVDDNAVVRRGVAALLGAADDIDVVGEAADGKEGVRLARELAPDVVLCDVRMPVMDGVAAAAAMSGETRVMMLTYSEEEDRVAAAINAGASGYLVHGRFDPDELERAVRDLAAGHNVLSPAVVPVVFDALRRTAGESSPSDGGQGPTELTAREREVMNLLCTGRSNREVAEALFVSEKTVKNHLNRIYAKLGVTSRTEAIARWLGITKEKKL